MVSNLKNKIEELNELLTIEIINPAGGISYEEVRALEELKSKIRKSLKVIAGREVLQDIKVEYDMEKKAKESDGVLRRSGRYPWNSKED